MITSFTPTLLPLPSIRLGRLLTNRSSPHERYHDPPDAPEPVVCPQKNYRAFASSSSTLTLRTRLAKMLGARYHRTQTESVDLSATQAYTYYMNNSDSWFLNACGDSEVRAFLQEAVEYGDSVYLVVGYHTVVDAAVAVNGGGGGKVQGSVTDGETIEVEAGYEGDTVQRSRWDAEGEQVYAVQYRKVKFRMFSSKKGVLGENRWRMYIKRGRKDVEDSIEASLEEKEGEGEGKMEVEVEGEVWLGEDGE
ncbi:hypothetical protein DFP73DRAFT_569825 [Morchella snyderi]|nr:hypothetical protein DFP73DRAFT_569825 [Morchella snyderi]